VIRGRFDFSTASTAFPLEVNSSLSSITTISRRAFLKKGAAAAAASSLTSRAASAAAFDASSAVRGERKLTAFDFEGVQVTGGMLQAQIRRTTDFYLGISNDDILKGFRKRAGIPAPGQEMGGWCEHDTAVIFGQWLSGMARLWRASGDKQLVEKATVLMRAWGETFAKDGKPYYFESYIASHYPFDKTLCGLVDMHHYVGIPEARPLLEKLVDWGSTTLGRARHAATPADPSGPTAEGIEWYTLAENLYRAYEYTGDSRYYEFGSLWRYPQYWGKFKGPEPIDIHGLHAYSHVNTLSSAAMSYAVTGSADYLDAIIGAYDYFQRAQVFATGGYGPGEQLVADDGTLGRSLEVESNSFETPCGSWAVFKLGRYLMEFTGEARYGDWIEKLVYNGIGAALPMADRTNPFFDDIWSKHGWNGGIQVADRGKTFYYADYRLGGSRKDYYYAGWPCCSGTYIQNIAEYHNLIYFKDSESLCVNLFVPSEVKWECGGTTIRVSQQTAYPESEQIMLTINPERNATFSLKLRVPGWADDASIKVNGEVVRTPARPGQWVVVRRRWAPGDRVEYTIPLRLRTVPIDRQHPNRVAVMYGPVVLVQEQRPRLTGPDPGKQIVPAGEALSFVVSAGRTTMLPFYRIGFNTPYSMYFELV
jgi:hypothetical protein